jgi:hypothetical protein
MSGELAAIWPYAWKEIWAPLMRHPEFGDDLALDLFRERVPEPSPQKAVTELSEVELAEFERAVRLHEEAAASALKAKAALKLRYFSKPIEEHATIAFLEKSFAIFDDYDANFGNEYFNRVDRFLKRYSLRYDLRRPLTLHPTLSGIFASLIRELRVVSLGDSHLRDLLSEFEESIRDLKNDLSQVRVKTCLQKQFNLLEAVGRSYPGVTCQTLGDISGQIKSWPHATIRDALKKPYGFRSDYPGVGHAGNPEGALRELDVRDVIAIGVMLTGFVPYLSDRMDARSVYGC